MDKYLAENPDIWPYIFDGIAMPKKEDVRMFNKVVGSVMMLWAFFEHVSGQMPSMSEDKRKGWENYIRSIYEISPAMRYYVDEFHKEWHSQKLMNLVRKGEEANKPKL